MTDRDDDPRALIAGVRRLVASPHALGGACSRAAAHLCRQALEQAIDEFWRVKSPAVRDASRRAQFVCLPAYVDGLVAGRAAFVWSSLSEACHHHVYDLSPSAAELLHWAETVEELITELHRVAMRA